MPPNTSKHLLPINSILFHTNNNKPSSHLLLSRPSNPTLANLRDAQDTTVTALPQPPTPATGPVKPNFWKRMWTKLKDVFCPEHETEKKQGDEKQEVRELCIGAPTGFKHVMTGGSQPMMGSVSVVVEDEGESEGEWEDVRGSQAGGGDPVWNRR